MLNVLYIVNEYKDKNFTLSKKIINFLINNNVNVCIDNKNLSKLYNLKPIELSNIDFTIILGGDGTILKYIHDYKLFDIPYLGINNGRVGALARVEINEYEKYLTKILNKEYFIEESPLLEAEINYKDKRKKKSKFYSYNDIVLHRGLSLKVLDIAISIDKSDYDSFFADGLIIASAKGSSAYNASCNGPLLAFNSNCYVLTPISAQSTSFIPFVISDSSVIDIYIKERIGINKDENIITVDGYDKLFISPLDHIRVFKSDKKVKMFKFDKKESFYMPSYKALKSVERGK